MSGARAFIDLTLLIGTFAPVKGRSGSWCCAAPLDPRRKHDPQPHDPMNAECLLVGSGSSWLRRASGVTEFQARH